MKYFDDNKKYKLFKSNYNNLSYLYYNYSFSRKEKKKKNSYISYQSECD